MQQKQEIWVKNYKPGKYRVCFLHTRDKWFVIEADSPEQARKIAKSQEKILIVKDDKTLLFGEFAKDFYNPQGEWAKYIERKGRQPYGGYYQRYQMCLNHYVLPRFSAVSMVLMIPVDIDEWLTDLCSYSTGKPLAARTKNIILTSISHIFDYAKFKGLVEKNPVDDIKLFTGSSPRPPFSRDEIARLFPEGEAIHKIWPNLTWLCFYLILRDTGLRTGEALALDWANYSQQHHCFAIVQKFEQSTNRILPGTKTGVARAVAVTKRTAEFLAKLQKKQGKESGLIFTLDGTKPYSENNVCDRLKDALERAGIPRIVNGRARLRQRPGIGYFEKSRIKGAKMKYYCALSVDSNNTFRVIFPDLPNIFTYGNNPSHALEMAEDALNLAMESMIELDEFIPDAVDHSEEGMHAVPVHKDIAKKVLMYKMAALQKELEALEA